MLKEKIELTDEQKKIDKIEKTTNFFIASRDTMMEIWCNAMINRFDKQNFDLPKIKKEIFKESGLTIPGGPDVAIVIATTTFKFPNLNDNFSFLDNIGMNSAQKDDEQKRKEINDQKINTEIMGMIALDTAFSSGIPKAYLNATAPFNASFSEDKVQTADPKEPRKAFHLDQKMGVKRVMVLNKKQLKDDFFTEYDLTDSLEKETQEDLIKFINTGKDNMKSVLEKDKWYEDSLLSKTLRLPLLNQQIYHCMKEEFIATERVYNINKEIKRNDAEALAALDEIYKSQPSFEIISNTEFDKIFAILNDSPTHVIDIKTHQDRINRFLKQMEKASHAQ